MGLEALAVTMAVGSAYGGIRQAREESKAITKKAEIEARNLKLQTKAMAGQQKTSFASSGLELEGTPMAVIQNTYETGITDTNQYIKNANRQAKNTWRAGLTNSLLGFGTSMALMYGPQGAFGGGTASGSSFNPATSAPPPKPTGV